MEEKFEIRDWVEFTNQGNKIFGVIHRPIGVEKAPAILFCHGLAGHKIGKHRMYVLLAECLARKGIASFRVDFRGSGDSEGNFAEMTLQGEVSDALQALKFLESQPYIDPEAMAIYGRSFGGPIAILAGEKFRKIKAIALWAPVYNAVQWEQMWEIATTHTMDEKERHELMRINGQLPSMSFYKELFELNMQKELDALKDVPMLHIHGEQDNIVNFSHADLFKKQRENSLVESIFIRLPHSDHDFTHPEEKVQAIQTTCEWFADQLLK